MLSRQRRTTRMKRTISAKIPVAEPNILPGFDGELGFYKDVYYPDLASGESPAEFFLRHVLACAGYETKRIETAPTHPVLIIHAFCRSVMQSTDQRWLIRHFQGLLQRAGFRLRRDELGATSSTCVPSRPFRWCCSWTRPKRSWDRPWPPS